MTTHEDDEAIRKALPEPAFWVAVDPTRHSMYPAYRTMAAMRRRASDDDRFEAAFTQGQMFAAVKAALERAEKGRPLMEAVAEVTWYDPALELCPRKAGKIIDASVAFMDSAALGTKLYATPESITQPEPDYWPSAKVTVHDDDSVTASLYAPGLPPGAYDLYLPGVAAQAQEARPLSRDTASYVWELARMYDRDPFLEQFAHALAAQSHPTPRAPLQDISDTDPNWVDPLFDAPEAPATTEACTGCLGKGCELCNGTGQSVFHRLTEAPAGDKR